MAQSINNPVILRRHYVQIAFGTMFVQQYFVLVQGSRLVFIAIKLTVDNLLLLSKTNIGGNIRKYIRNKKQKCCQL